MTNRDHALTIRLPETLHEQLKKRAATEERTVAGIIRIAAKRYLTETEPIGNGGSGRGDVE